MNEENIEKRIKKITLLSSTIIIFLVATIIGTNLIKTEYDNFKNHINNFKNTIIEREKFYIKTSIENLKNDIHFEELSILNNKKIKVKNQSIIAYNLTSSLYENSKSLPKNEQRKLIISSLNEISQKDNDIHYFIIDLKGNILLNTQSPNDEGFNFLNFTDINGVKFINEMINAPKVSQNYLEYYWYKPNKRITYSRHFEDLGIIIGSASYLESNKKELKDRLIKKIINEYFNKEEFLFIYKINSLNNITTQSDLIIQKNISPKDDELNAMKKLMINSNYKGNDYIIYNNNQKIFYGTFFPNLRYFIAVGLNLSHIYDIIENERVISLNNMYSNIGKLFTIITIMTIIFFIFSILFTKKIEKLFEKYKKQENLLIQKSKMASMGEMIGNIAHQWRQPLSQISGLFLDIESAYDYKELDKKYLSNRVDEANDLLEYMSRTIDDFRNFFNPNSIKEEFYINESIKNAINIVDSTLKYHNIHIENKVINDTKINGFKNEYAQAIVNIISNAKDILIERKIKNPMIKIYMQDNYSLCIEDNAGGIDKTIINKIFDPYFTTKFDYGTGIGLYMTKLIIEEKMNGSIDVKNSENGAIFIIKV